jgi:hypothetical protein
MTNENEQYLADLKAKAEAFTPIIDAAEKLYKQRRYQLNDALDIVKELFVKAKDEAYKPYRDAETAQSLAWREYQSALDWIEED